MRVGFVNAVGGVAALALFLAAAAPAVGADAPVKEKFQVGQQAPDFALQDLSGKTFRLSDFTGKKPVLLAFWALRCGACREESPHLERLYRQYRDKGLAVLSVDTDGVDAKTTAEIMKEIGLAVSYPVLIDPDFAVSDVYTNFIVPLTLVIDRAGVIRFVHTGFEKGMEKKYEEAILEALGR